MWLKSSGSVPLKLLTIPSLEAIVNILERFTAHSKEPIPLPHALKIVGDDFAALPGWEAASVELIVPLVYNYWTSKRMRLGKPLCRRYWPTVTSSDTNPHQVFRYYIKVAYFVVWLLPNLHRKYY